MFDVWHAPNWDAFERVCGFLRLLTLRFSLVGLLGAAQVALLTIFVIFDGDAS